MATQAGMVAGGFIDIHHHAPLEEFRRVLQDAGVPASRVPPWPSWTPEASAEMMRDVGLDGILLSPPVMPLELASPMSAGPLCRRVNERLTEIARALNGHNGALAILPLPNVGESLAELSRALDQLGASGVMLQTNYSGRYLGDSELQPLWEELDRRAAFVLVHPTAPPVPSTAAIPVPPSLLDFPFDTTRAAVDLLYSGTLEAYQSIKFVLAHGGGTIPYLAHRIGLGHLLDAFPPLAAEPTGALLRRFHFEVAMCAGPTTLATLTGFADPHRILCGTDFPFMPREEVLAMVRCLAEAVGPDGTGLIDTIRQNGRHLGSATGFRTRTP